MSDPVDPRDACICAEWSGRGSDGPDPDCPVHGRVADPADLDAILQRADTSNSIQVCPNEHTIAKDDTRVTITCDEWGELGALILHPSEDDTSVQLWIGQVMEAHTESVLRRDVRVLVEEVQRLRRVIFDNDCDSRRRAP